MIVKTIEKQIQKLKAKFPNLSISRINENTWEILGKNILPGDESEIRFFLQENQGKEIKMAEVAQQPQVKNVEQQGVSKASAAMTEGLAILAFAIKSEIVPPIEDEINKLKEADKRHYEDNFNFSNSVSKHFEQVDRLQVDSEKKVLEHQTKIDESKRDIDALKASIEETKKRTEKLSEKLQKLPGVIADALKS